MIKITLIIVVVIFGGWKAWNVYYFDWQSKQSETDEKETVLAENQIVQEDGLPTIELALDEGDSVTQEEWEIQLSAIRNTPSYLWKNCRYVIFESQDKVTAGVGHKISVGAEALDVDGYTSDDLIVHMTLYTTQAPDYDDGSDFVEMEDGRTITPKEATEEYNNDIANNYYDTMIHELWHDYDFVNGITQRQDFVNLYTSAPNSLGEYGATDIMEFFAVAGTRYVCWPDDLKEQNMDVYNFFEALPKE